MRATEPSNLRGQGGRARRSELALAVGKTGMTLPFAFCSFAAFFDSSHSPTHAAGTTRGNLPMILVASPDYIQQNGMPDTIGALSHHAHIRYMLNGRPFPILFEGGEQFVPQAGFDTDSGEAMKIAARNGLDIAQILRASVAAELASGQLVRVLVERPLPAVPVQALHAFARAAPLRAQALFQFLDAEMARWRDG